MQDFLPPLFSIPCCCGRKREALALGPPLQWSVLGYAQDRNQMKAGYDVKQIYEKYSSESKAEGTTPQAG